MRIEVLDLGYRDTPMTIAAFLVFGEDGGAPVLVETGPESTLPALERGLAAHGVESGDIRHVLLSHIHLDHAGAAGWWATRGARVYVHPRGAPHLIDPSKLIASATRIYGDQMDALWGPITPAPAEFVTGIEDGDKIEIAGLEFTAIETPGHARHHHVYRLGDVAFTGDAAGIRIPGSTWIDLPAPPPEFDLEVWKGTLDRLRRENFATFYRTHFGPSGDVAAELDRFEALLERTVEKVGELGRSDLDRDRSIATYSEWIAAQARCEGAGDAEIRAYEVSNPRAMSIDGIARYLSRLG